MKKIPNILSTIFSFVILVAAPSVSAATLYIGGPGGPGASPGGGSSVTSGDGSINCGADCTGDINQDETITLTFNPGSNISFDSWSVYGGSCAGGNSNPVCTFTAGSYGSFSAKPNWHYSTYSLNVTKSGSGSGTVTGAGLSCGSDCSTSGSFSGFSATHNLTATPASGSVFAGWDTSGDVCNAYSGAGKGGAVIINPSASCTASLSGSKNSFTAVAIFNKTSSSSSSSSNSSGTSSGSTSTSSTTTTASEPVAAPSSEAEATKSLSDLSINGEKIDPAKNEKKEFSTDKPIVLSGKTIPNGVVTLYVFSEPKKYTVTADSNGLWSIEVAGLPAGDHHAEVEVTDPATNTTSQRTKLLEFAVKSAATETASVNNPVVKASSSKLGLLIGAVVTGLILLGTGTILALRHFKPELFNRLKSSITSKFHKTTPPTIPSV